MAYILAIISGVIFLAADQISKFIVVSNMQLNGAKDFIPGFLNFWYIHNEGGAWGFLSGHTWILLSLTIVIMLICLALVLKCGSGNKLLFFSVCLIVSGGFGNMIDRIFRKGCVVDFLQFDFNPLKNFPVFNIADCAIVLGACLLVLYFIIDTVREIRVKK